MCAFHVGPDLHAFIFHLGPTVITQLSVLQLRRVRNRTHALARTGQRPTM